MDLQRAWLRRGALAWSLLPLAGLYRGLGALHRGLYRAGLLRPERLPVPVVVVGNVVAGGAGKTPVVIAVIEHLRSQGLKPGVISRGYGRTGSDCRLVTPHSTSSQVGDEPLLIARRCQVPVAVAPGRADAARLLLRAHPHTQILVSDDGLQHPALARDLEICVFDERGTGNGWPIPAGPLREAWPRPADLVLRPAGLDIDAAAPAFDIARGLAPEAVRADGTRRRLSDLAGEREVAVAGIARPEVFFRMLEAAGLAAARTRALSDHHDFETHPVPLPGDMAVVCTEKDAVKLWHLRPDAWAVPLHVQIAPAFWPAFDRLLAAKLSSNDGSQTA